MHTNIGRTESTGQTSQAVQIPVLPANGSKLKNGDVVIVAVERIEGDVLTLRISDGTLLRAALQAECSLAQGDMIEALVDKSNDGCLLHMLNVSRAGTPAGTGGEAQAVSQPVLSGMLAMLKRNPGMEADAARFLVENSIPDTAENIAALTQLSGGTGIGALLGKILGYLAQPDDAQAQTPGFSAEEASLPDAPAQQRGGTLMESADAQRSGSQTPSMTQAGITGGSPEAAQGTAAAVFPEAGQAESLPAQPEGPALWAQAAEAPVGEDTHAEGRPAIRDARIPETETPVGDAATQAQKMNARVQGTIIKEPDQPSRTVPGPARQDGTPDDTPVQHDRTAAETAMAQKQPGAQGKLSARIGGMIRSIFVRPDALTGDHVKKTVVDIPERLKALKSLLVQSDIKNKELCLKSADQALRQMELADRDVRFEHMQVPLCVKDGAYQTAELYVFRYQKQRESGGAGISILVALDTQHIGRVETLIREAGGSISLEFRLEHVEAAALFKRNGKSLEQAVEAAGYRLTGVRFTGLEKRTTVLNAGEAAALEAGKAPQGIDIKI